MPYTAPQQQVMEKVWELLREHFDSVVLLVDTENSEGTDRVFEMRWHGGVTTSIGLCERGRARIERHAMECDPDDPENE
jgi:hypothetical protein